MWNHRQKKKPHTMNDRSGPQSLCEVKRDLDFTDLIFLILQTCTTPAKLALAVILNSQTDFSHSSRDQTGPRPILFFDMQLRSWLCTIHANEMSDYFKYSNHHSNVHFSCFAGPPLRLSPVTSYLQRCRD